ncbi:MAG TPA: hypothetical protein VIN10_12625 [Bacteroidales bacterium]
MNNEENIVSEYLKSIGFNLIKYEPNGNVPPDFSIEDNNIAIEVRRLNENYFSGNKTIGYQEEFYQIWQFLEQFLEQYTNENLRKSYWISFSFMRPIPKIKVLKKKLKQHLDNYFLNPLDDVELEITETFSIRLYFKELDAKPKLLLTSSHDENSGGVVSQIYLNNINHCIEEKTKKIQNYRASYQVWWIILVDTLVYRMSKSNDFEKISNNIILPKIWNKLIILNSEDKTPLIIISN